MKKEKTFDKYGYKLKSIKAINYQYHRYYIDLEFISKDGITENLILKLYAKNIFKALILKNQIKKLVQGKNIVECLAILITFKYQFREYFNSNFYQLVGCLPQDLINNNEAVKNLLALLPEHNKHLYIETATFLNNQRQRLKQIKDNITSSIEYLETQKSQIDKELGL